MAAMRNLTAAAIALGMLWVAPQPRNISFARGGGVLPGPMQLFISASDGSDELLAIRRECRLVLVGRIGSKLREVRAIGVDAEQIP